MSSCRATNAKVVRSCRCFDASGKVTLVTCEACKAKLPVASHAHRMATDYLAGPGLQRWKEAVLKAVLDAAATGRFEALVPALDTDEAKAWLKSEDLAHVGTIGSAPFERVEWFLSWWKP